MAQRGTQAFAVNTAPAADGAPVIATPAAAVNNPTAPAIATPVTTHPAGSKGAAVAAAVARAQQIAAPEALVAQQSAQVGQQFDQAAATRARNDSSFGALTGAYRRNTGNYLGELDAARPIMEQRTQLAVQQIMAERQMADRRAALESRQLTLNERELSLKEKQFAASLSGTGAGMPYTPSQAARNIGLDAKTTRKVLSDPAYDQGRQLVLSALEDGYSYEELDGLLRSYQQSGITDPNTGVAVPFSYEVSRLLAETYKPVFTRQGEEQTSEAITAETAGTLANRQEILARMFPGAYGAPKSKPVTKLDQDAARYRASTRGSSGV